MTLTHMNKTLPFIAAMFVASNALCQIPVTDVGAIAQSAADQVSNLAKYVEMVNNQMQQITLLTNQLNQVTAYVEAIGDPSTLLSIVGADELIDSINRSGVGQTIGSLQQLANGVDALRYNANGLYSSVGNTFTTFKGIQVPRAADFYKKFSAIDKAAGNYADVYDDVFDRRQVLKGRIADTTRQLQSATTDAETQKLTGVLVGQGTQLQAIDKEIDFAATQAVVQEIENRNDKERQSQARAEEKLAEFNEAMESYSKTFTISTRPPVWSGDAAK